MCKEGLSERFVRALWSFMELCICSTRLGAEVDPLNLVRDERVRLRISDYLPRNRLHLCC